MEERLNQKNAMQRKFFKRRNNFFKKCSEQFARAKHLSELCTVKQKQLEIKNMRTHVAPSDTASSTFLTGAILFANVDYSGLGGYAVKAAIGGAIWMTFKLAGDYLSDRLLNRKKYKEEKDDENQIEEKQD